MNRIFSIFLLISLILLGQTLCFGQHFENNHRETNFNAYTTNIGAYNSVSIRNSFKVGENSSETKFKPVPRLFSAPLRFSSSNLPILIIETQNHSDIPDEPKLGAVMKIINNASGINHINDTPNEYDGVIGIELRGNSTKGFPKKPYNLETRNSNGENLNVSLFGWPKENDWVLRASYLDHTFIRNGLANHLSRLNGWWAARTQLVEVVLNGNYQGIYVFMEDIKADKGRLNIATLNPEEITEPEISGGYIWEITGFNTNLGKSRKLKYPSYQIAAAEQINYIENFDDQFRSLMKSSLFKDREKGYSKWINVESFVNEILVQEAMRNGDAYGWSGYFHKDREGKINAGPVWDFDQSAGNSSYPDDGVVEGWMFEHPNTNNTPFFWPRLFDDPEFRYAVCHRWEELRETVYSTENIFGYIDSISNILSEAQEREFEIWPTLGKNFWRETKGFRQRNTYQKEVDYLKSFLDERWEWMDDELKQYRNLKTSSDLVCSNGNIDVYPNPVRRLLNVRIDIENINSLELHIFSCTGFCIYKKIVNPNEYRKGLYTLDLSQTCRPGMYILKIIINNDQEYITRLVKTDY